MKTGHLTPRPMLNRGEKSITWARSIPPANVSDGITYKLAKRDLDGKIVQVTLTFFRSHTRDAIAASVAAARKGLLSTVDDRDMVILGLTEGMAA
jgi:hypothetical protein